MISAQQDAATERALALSAHARHRAFQADIAARAAALRAPREKPRPPCAVASAAPVAPPAGSPWFWIVDEAPRRVTLLQIQQAVCAHYGVQMGDMLSWRRTKAVIIPRHVAMYLCKLLTPKSFVAIGTAFGRRDHTTALRACQKIEQMILNDAQIAADVAALRSRLEGIAP